MQLVVGWPVAWATCTLTRPSAATSAVGWVTGFHGRPTPGETCARFANRMAKVQDYLNSAESTARDGGGSASLAEPLRERCRRLAHPNGDRSPPFLNEATVTATDRKHVEGRIASSWRFQHQST